VPTLSAENHTTGATRIAWRTHHQDIPVAALAPSLRWMLPLMTHVQSVCHPSRVRSHVET
jgi:hypothetical protein